MTGACNVVLAASGCHAPVMPWSQSLWSPPHGCVGMQVAPTAAPIFTFDQVNQTSHAVTFSDFSSNDSMHDSETEWTDAKNGFSVNDIARLPRKGESANATTLQKDMVGRILEITDDDLTLVKFGDGPRSFCGPV